MDLLEGLWRDRGLTLVIVTHDSAVAKRAERRLHITNGTGDRAQVTGTSTADAAAGCAAAASAAPRRAPRAHAAVQRGSAMR
jgi:ABC-type thiamine transport system ATPase subunit